MKEVNDLIMERNELLDLLKECFDNLYVGDPKQEELHQKLRAILKEYNRI